MHVEVQVRYLLVGALTGRVPDTQTVARKDGRDSLCNADDGSHDCLRRSRVGHANVGDMAARYHQRVSGMKLPDVQKRERLRVLKDQTGGMKA